MSEASDQMEERHRAERAELMAAIRAQLHESLAKTGQAAGIERWAQGEAEKLANKQYDEWRSLATAAAPAAPQPRPEPPAS